MRRRAWLMGIAVVGGVAAGAGAAVWRARQSAPKGSTSPADLWSMSFVTVDGGPVPMAQFRDQRLLLNFWATWCPPCVAELALLDGFARTHGAAGWRVLALAIDTAEPVRRFTKERGLKLPIALAGADGLGLSRRLGNAQGGLPFTVAFDNQGHATKRRVGALDPSLLEAWAQQMS